MQQAGIPEEEAKEIEKQYHILYGHSDKWVADQLDQACKDGFVTGAFGLRLRTPVLAKTILGHKSTPREAAAEGRTAGNMLGQSYGLLNNRAANAFMQKVWDSPYAESILPVNFIHDATYYLVRNKPSVVKFVNDHLPAEMLWQDLEEIAHPTVGLGGELGIFYPNWSNEITLPNNASTEEIINICKSEVKKLND